MSAARRQSALTLALAEHGAQTLRELGARLGFDTTTINDDLRHMMDAGVVARDEIEGWRGVRSKAGRYRYRLEDAA